MLWRIWDGQKPFALFIGLNPSKADDVSDDPTTKRIKAHSKRLGFGGFFLINCFPTIATDPKHLKQPGNWRKNLAWLKKVAPICNTVIFIWGKNKLVRDLGRDVYFRNLFPNAKQFGQNLDGSPKHPLYLSYSSKLESTRPSSP